MEVIFRHNKYFKIYFFLAAAMIIGSSPSPNEKCLFEILKASCFAIPNSTEKIRWDLSNTGWKVKIYLLKYI